MMEPRHTAAELKMFAVRAQHNHESMTAFAGAVVGLGILCVVLQLIQRVGKGAAPRPVRTVRSVLIQKAPRLPSRGHALLVCLYLTINIIIAFTNIDSHYSPMTASLASRFGWLAMGNLSVLVLLALKNVPLALLGPYSYERLNILHQVIGSVTITCVILHASLFSSYFVSQGRISFLLRSQEVMGMVAGLSFLMMGVSGAIIRRWWYEAFYLMHVTFWTVALIALGLHQPEMLEKIVYITIAVGSVWVLERLVRFTKLLYNSVNNEVKLTPLPNGATRVSLKKAPVGAVAGKHCYLWIPSVKMWQTHPFTMSSIGPVEFVIKARGGFTDELYKRALVHPDTAVKASVEGPYGSFPDQVSYDKVVFIAGGSGASFTFGTALAMLDRLHQDKTIVFIWVAKDYGHLEWYPEQISRLVSDCRVRVQLFITRHAPVCPMANFSFEDTDGPKVADEKVTSTTTQLHMQRSQGLSDTESSVAAATVAEFTGRGGGTMAHGKPNVDQLIKTETQGLGKTEQILVMACGPQEMMADVRKGVAESVRSDGGGIELHCEQFGW